MHHAGGEDRSVRAALCERAEPADLLAQLALPADADALGLARLATLHVAGLLGVPVGRLTELRLAVNEACALLGTVRGPDPGAVPARASGVNAAPGRQPTSRRKNPRTAEPATARNRRAVLPLSRSSDREWDLASAPLPARPSATAVVRLRYERRGDRLRIEVRGPAPYRGPRAGDVGWVLLQALVPEVRMDTADGITTLTLLEPLPAA